MASRVPASDVRILPPLRSDHRFPISDLIEQMVRYLKQQVLLAAAEAGEGHVPSAFSIIDIVWVLFDRVLRYNHEQPRWEQRDRFVLSKGHGSLALYAVLSVKGFFPVEYLKRFARFDSPLGGHPDCEKVPGIEASTGSLGHGFPMAIGMAIGLRVKKSESRVFCLIGDGEANEGTTWEAALLACHHRLSNLTCIVDFNHSTDRALGLGDLTAKFRSFGWETIDVNGHDHTELERVFKLPMRGMPRAIIAATVKGKGCRLIENNSAWHHRAPTSEDLALLLEDLR